MSKDQDDKLFKQLQDVPQRDIAAAAQNKNPPPSEEELDGFKKRDEYSVSKVVSETKELAVRVFGWLLILVGVFLVLMLVWTTYVFFDTLVDDPKRVADFLDRGKDLVLISSSTLFLNYVLTKKE